MTILRNNFSLEGAAETDCLAIGPRATLSTLGQKQTLVVSVLATAPGSQLSLARVSLRNRGLSAVCPSKPPPSSPPRLAAPSSRKRPRYPVLPRDEQLHDVDVDQDRAAAQRGRQ